MKHAYQRGDLVEVENYIARIIRIAPTILDPVSFTFKQGIIIQYLDGPDTNYHRFNLYSTKIRKLTEKEIIIFKVINS